VALESLTFEAPTNGQRSNQLMQFLQVKATPGERADR